MSTVMLLYLRDTLEDRINATDPNDWHQLEPLQKELEKVFCKLVATPRYDVRLAMLAYEGVY